MGMYAWEIMFKDKVEEIRRKELAELKRAAWLNAFTSFTFICAPFIVSLATFAVYVLSDPLNVLDAEKTFVSLSLFHLMRFPMMMLPNTITGLIQANVSVKRLSKYLCKEEIDETAVDRSAKKKDEKAIKLSNATFKWASDDATDTLKDISIEVEHGSLVAIVGQVGCGKSSLISAILGDMEKQQGHVAVNGRTAYVAQQSWIQNLTVRNNILFGSKANEITYDHVVQACELQSDLDMLPAGDATEIGERGINLSGGQKQRVSIARAVYQNADIYLFDDPLSAVDAHVGRSIFDNVISADGVLAGKTRLLVTHGISYLPNVDKIIVLVDGRVSEMGSYDELIGKQGDFADFIKNHTFDDGDSDDNPSENGEDTKSNNRSKINLRRSTISKKNVFLKQDSGNFSDKSLKRIDELAKKSSQYGLLEGKSSGKKLYEKEKAEVGNVKLSVYKTYMEAIGGLLCIVIVLFVVLQNVALVASNIWLSDWSEDEIKADGTQDGTMTRLGVYGALGLVQSIFALSGSVILFTSGIDASGIIHNRMIHQMMYSPLRFFDVTPVGRIINRCGKDTDVMDDILIRSISAVLACGCRVLATVIVICWATWYFVIALVPIFLLYYYVQNFYVKISRQLKRLQSVSRSPIFSHFGETLTGVSTIRAYNMQDTFIRQSSQKVDNNHMSYYPNVVSNRWLAFRLEMVANLIILLAAIFAVADRGNVSAGIIGLSVSYAMQVTQTFNWMVRMTSEMESNIVAVERIEEYTNVEQEAPYHTSAEPPANWPVDGKVEFRNYSTRYRPELDLVVKNISFTVEGGEKVGIVGRTGAGKSSLTLALFRIIEASEGSITIDGFKLNDIGLLDLRSKLAIIPQEPILFSGTLRFNLDPFDAFTDDDLWETLRHSHLYAFVSSLPKKLEHEISEGGENLSVGQRQLVCLARALLRKSKILVLDEATAAVDLETDDLIQTTIRELFKDATTFTIAHRLNTIMDSDKILVLDAGKISQFGSPNDLLEMKSGIFYNMAHDAGIV